MQHADQSSFGKGGKQENPIASFAIEVITHTPKGEMEYLSPILGMPWLAPKCEQLGVW